MADDRKATVEMCHQMQPSVADYHRSGYHEEASATPFRPADERGYYPTWRNLGIRKAWVTLGENPAMDGLKLIEMTTLLKDLALASDETTLQHISPDSASGRTLSLIHI